MKLEKNRCHFAKCPTVHCLIRQQLRIAHSKFSAAPSGLNRASTWIDFQRELFVIVVGSRTEIRRQLAPVKAFPGGVCAQKKHNAASARLTSHSGTARSKVATQTMTHNSCIIFCQCLRKQVVAISWAKLPTRRQRLTAPTVPKTRITWLWTVGNTEGPYKLSTSLSTKGNRTLSNVELLEKFNTNSFQVCKV